MRIKNISMIVRESVLSEIPRVTLLPYNLQILVIGDCFFLSTFSHYTSKISEFAFALTDGIQQQLNSIWRTRSNNQK